MDNQYQNSEPVRSGDYNTGGSNDYAVPPKKKAGLAIASLILGLLSLAGFCCCGINIITAPLAIIFGIVSLAKKRGGTGMAITGIITAVLSLLIIVGMVFSIRDILPYSNEIVQDYMQLMVDQDEVFPAYEEDGTLPEYLEKYKEPPYSDMLTKRGITINTLMDTLLEMYKNGQLAQYKMAAQQQQQAGNVTPVTSITDVSVTEPDPVI